MTTALDLSTILGMKIKRLRQQRRLTLTELAARMGLALSYVAEIERGRKYPRAERILKFAQVLDTSYDSLISTTLDPELDGVQKFLALPGVRDFPFDKFGLPIGDLRRLLTRSPQEMAALLKTLGEVARRYNLTVEHFLHAALRSYQELTDNYYESVEREANEFAETLDAGSDPRALLTALRAWVGTNCVGEIDEQTLAQRPALSRFRSAVVCRPRPKLLINPQLADPQKALVLTREAGYHILGLKVRSWTSPPDRDESFEQVLNDFMASYFAGAVLLPEARLVPDLKHLFRLREWQGEAVLRLLDKYSVTPDTLMYRIGQLLPVHFGLGTHFLKFTDEGGQMTLVKHLNLSDLPLAAGSAPSDHHCRRWLSTRLLLEFADRRRRHLQCREQAIVGAQFSTFVDHEMPYFCLGLAYPSPLDPQVSCSLTLGFKADDKFFKVVRFARDRTLTHLLINVSCEDCRLMADECGDRAAPPSRYLHQVRQLDRQRELALMGTPGVPSESRPLAATPPHAFHAPPPRDVSSGGQIAKAGRRLRRPATPVGG